MCRMPAVRDEPLSIENQQATRTNPIRDIWQKCSQSYLITKRGLFMFVQCESWINNEQKWKTWNTSEKTWTWNMTHCNPLQSAPILQRPTRQAALREVGRSFAAQRHDSWVKVQQWRGMVLSVLCTVLWCAIYRMESNETRSETCITCNIMHENWENMRMNTYSHMTKWMVLNIPWTFA